MATWAFYSNAALTGSAMTEIPATTYPTSTITVWFGSTTSGYQLQAASDPGTDHLFLSVVDSATGTGHATTAIKLATTSGGLATATAGAALDLDTVIYGGVSLAQERAQLDGHRGIQRQPAAQHPPVAGEGEDQEYAQAVAGARQHHRQGAEGEAHWRWHDHQESAD